MLNGKIKTSLNTPSAAKCKNILHAHPIYPMRCGVDKIVDQIRLVDAKIYLKLCVSSQEKLFIFGRATDL